MEAPKFTFAIIKHRGDLNHAETADGYKVHRKNKIYFSEHGWIKCAPYDNHFIYDDPMAYKIIGRWSPMCSCGSPAGIVGYNAYINDATPTNKKESTIAGEMLVCLAHAQYNRHADGSN
jgi:hypothetical protein